MTREEAELVTSHASALTQAVIAALQNDLPEMHKNLERAGELKQELFELVDQNEK